jgi:Lhr-like helicase
MKVRSNLSFQDISCIIVQTHHSSVKEEKEKEKEKKIKSKQKKVKMLTQQRDVSDQ